MDKIEHFQKECTQSVPKKESRASLKAINTQPEQAGLIRQQEIVDVLNRQNMVRYLKGLSQCCNSQALVSQASKKVIEKASLSLERGILEISLNPPPIPKKLPYNHKTAQQEEKQMQAKSKREEMSRKLRFLDEQIRCGTTKERANEQGFDIEIKQILTKEQHQHKVKQLTEGWMERKRRQKEFQNQETLKQHQEEVHEQELRQIQKQKQAQAKRSLIQTKIQQRKKQHSQFLSEQSKFEEQLLSAKEKDCLYVKMEQRYVSEVVLPALEERKNKLKQIRNFNNRYDSAVINQHEKKYLLARNSSHSEKKSEQNSLESKWQPPFRTAKLTKLLEQQKIQQKQKLEEHKKKMEEHARRQQNFISELKSKVKLTVDPAKKQEIERRLIEEHKKRERPIIDARRIGEAYMEIAKKIAKPQHLRNSEVKSRTTEEKKNISQLKNFLLPRDRSPQFYQHQRKRRMEGILNSECSVNQKCQLLQMETDKLQEKIRQQEQLDRVKGQDEQTGELLLCSIQAKMGLIQLLTKQKSDQ